MKSRNPKGRVDVLLSRLIEEAVGQSSDPTLKMLHAGAKPGLDLLFKENLGPRTKRGREIAAHVTEAQAAVQRMQDARRKQEGQRV